MKKNGTITEADILEQVIGLGTADLDPEVARGLLKMKFSSAATRTIRKLLRQNNRGTITAEDRIVLQQYLDLGQFIDLLQAQARLALRQRTRAR
jgi:hypothetical protein